MGTHHLYTRAPLSLALAAVVSLAAVGVRAQTNGTPARYTAAAFNLNRGAAGSIEIVVDRWSSDADRDRLISALRDHGSERLLTVLQDLPRMGYFRAPGSLGIDIHFARRAALPDGGERVTLITDRRIGFWEAANQPRSIDYPFTVIELRLNKEGEGEGKLSIATKVIVAKDKTIALENYDLQPVMLTQVKQERVTTEQ
jgi:hypothetical protein